jgi:hypothetical protein
MKTGKPKQMNIYEQFLDYVRNKTYPEGTLTEFHHEPPHHTKKSSDSSPNNVRASVEDHVLLHQYRWIVYNEKGDYLMFKGRQGDTQEFRKTMNERRIEVTQSRGSGFWDPELQSVLGKRGGPKGGSANTEEQFISRQNVGTIYGRSNGISNQSENLKRVLSSSIKLKHKTGVTIEVSLECAEDLRNILKPFGFKLPKCSPSGMLMGQKPWGGWVVFNRSFDNRKENTPTKWASIKGNLSRHGFRVSDLVLFPPDKEYRLCLSETFLEYCRLYGNPVGSRPSVGGTARD